MTSNNASLKTLHAVVVLKIVVFRGVEKVLAHLTTELDLRRGQSVAKAYQNLVRSLDKSGKSLYEEETLKVSCENNGLAGTLYTTCTRRTQRFKGHKTKCGHKLMKSSSQGTKNTCADMQ